MEGRLRELLEGLLARGIRGVALLRPDGLLLEAVGEASGAAERAAALLGLGVALAQSEGEEVAELVVEYPEGALFLAPVAGHHLLLLLEDLQDLGRARVTLKGARPRIEGGVSMNELKLDIHIDKDVAQGRYANLALIAHTKNEFILDFALLQPQGGALVVSRIITSPQHAKALLRSLAENIARYEEAFGPIPEPVAESQA